MGTPAQKRSAEPNDEDIEAGIPLNPVPPEESPPQKSDPCSPTPADEPFNAFLFEWRTRFFLYTVYFLLVLSLSWNCFSVTEGCLTATGILTLIILRTVVTDKCDPVDVTLTPKSSATWRTKCGHYCSWVTCWVMTLIVLVSFAFVNLVQSRIIDRDRILQNCAQWGNNW